MCNQIRLIVFLISLNLSGFIVECTTRVSLCKDITSKSVELRLKTHLFCDYDPDVRPMDSHKNTTMVGLTIMPKFIEFNDMVNTLDVHGWTVMNWTDPHLIWKPEDFDGVDSLHVQSDELWIPDITVHNSGDANKEQTAMPKTTCGLSNDGGIICIPAIKYSVHCESDYTEYPYDLQLCSVELASWAYNSNEIFLLLPHGIVMSDFSPNAEWQVLYSHTYVTSDDFKMNKTFEARLYSLLFVLQRRAAGIHIIYIIPAIVLMVMTLSVLWLDCHSIERMILASINFICHLLCVQNLYWNIPHNGGVSPYILRFYESSFLLMAFSLVLTVLLRELRALKSPAPRWLTSATSLVLQSKAGQLLLLSILDPKASAFLEMSADDNADLVHGDKPASGTWSYVTLLVGWLAFIAVFLAYIVMLALYLPVKANFDASAFPK